jgi:protein-disulfide isomerase
VAGIACAQTGPAPAADDLRSISKDVEALKAGQAALQKDLQEIKSLLQGAQAAPQQPAAASGRGSGAETVDVTLSVADAPTKGAKDAKVTLVEFTDYQCPFCSRHFRQTWPQLEQEYVNTGKVKFVLRDMPLEAIHPQALNAAEAARCAGEQGKYWEMHDRLFANQSALARKDLSTYAQALGLDGGAFDKCVDTAKYKVEIRNDAIDATRAGGRGTPVFFLGLTEQHGTELKASRIIRGAQSYAVFKDAIDAILASAK